MKQIQSLLFRSLVFTIGFTWILNSFLIKDSFSLGKLLNQDLLNSNNEKNPEKVKTNELGKEPEIPATTTPTKGKTNELGKEPEIPPTPTPTPTKGKTFEIKDGFLNKAKIAGLTIGIDTTLGNGVFDAMEVLADNGLVVAKLDIKGNDQVKAKVMKAISISITAAPVAGSYLEEIVKKLAPKEATVNTRTADFTTSQALVLPNAANTLVDAYPIARTDYIPINLAKDYLAIQTISVKIHNGSPYLYIIFKTDVAENATIAQQIGIDHLTGTDNVTFQTTNFNNLSEIDMLKAANLTGTPNYEKTENICDPKDIIHLRNCIGSNGLVLTTLPFKEFFIPATAPKKERWGWRYFKNALDYLVLLKKFARSYVKVMGTMPENSTMGLIDKAIPSENKDDYYNLKNARIPTTAKYLSYTGASDFDLRGETIVLSLKKFKKN